MALIFLGVLIVLAVSSLDFHQELPLFISSNEWPPVNQTSVHGIITFGDYWSLITSSIEAKTVPEFKNALQLIWSALRESHFDNAVKDYCK